MKPSLKYVIRLTAILASLWVSYVILMTAVWSFAPAYSTIMLGRWLAFQPVKREWISIDDISPRLVASIVASEDARFCLHGGVDFIEMKKVIKQAIKGTPTRGASTITMQTAKNLFLWPSRSYIRKLLELPLATWLELTLSKKRILEIYLNIVELGPGIFGVEEGSVYTFNKSASYVSAREASLLATSLPNPIERNAKEPKRGQQRLATIIMARASNNQSLLSCIKIKH